ncbi:MAG: DUF3352 domain-containing protein [Chloroflexota bacterium]
MRRVVVASTSLLVLLGGAVVVSYLLLFSAVTDRASRAVPADTALYLNVYLQPSTGQQMNLMGLIGKLQGFGDPAALEGKIDEVAQRLLGEAGIDYVADLRPWLGAQIAFAAAPGDTGPTPGELLLVAVKDPAAAREAVPRLFAGLEVSLKADVFRGRDVMLSDGTSYALLNDLLIVANTPDRLRAALEADADVAPALADSPAFAAAMRDVPADHLASVYLDVPRALGLTEMGQIGGFGTAGLAITADADGLHLGGIARFEADSASEAARAAFALGRQTSSLGDWMPLDTRLEAVLFGVAQSFEDLEASLAAEDAFAPAADALNQLRGIASLGLGINLDRDLLPLLDGEVGVALRELDLDGPHGQLLLRPSDPEAAQDALARMRSSLADRGARVTTDQVSGTSLTTLAIPQIGTIAFAVVDGVVVVGLDADDVAAALRAHAAGETVGGSQRYRTAFVLAGGRAGNEIWADVPSGVDALAGIFDPGSELRDILHQIGELAISATATDDRLEIDGVLTVK